MRARLIALLTDLYAGARDHYWGVADGLSELIAGYPTMDMIEPDVLRGYLEVVIRDV